MNKNIELKILPIDKLQESPNNPRKRFDVAALAELSESIKSSGILTPILVRPSAKGFEIGAGHRRFRASKMAGLKDVPCIVRDMDDQKFLELLVIENDQREDVHPLEEAQGYFSLSRHPGYDVRKISNKIGRSEKYVYDRLKLLALTKEAQEMFLENKFTAGHAIILARLSPVDQAKCLQLDQGGMFQRESYPLFSEEEKDPVKARSVRELQAWIDGNVRFDRSKVDQMVFPETADTLRAATEKAEKVVPITEDNYVNPSARDKEKIIGPRSWERADGKNKSKTCEHSVTGVFVVGRGRGQSMKVCIAKEKCKIHWGQWQKERERRQDPKSSGSNSKELERRKAEEEKQAKERKAREERKALWEKSEALLRKTIIDSLAKAPIATLANAIIEKIDGNNTKIPGLDRGRTPEDLIRFMAGFVLIDETTGWNADTNFPPIAKKYLGLDVWKIINENSTKATDKNKKNNK